MFGVYWGYTGMMKVNWKLLFRVSGSDPLGTCTLKLCPMNRLYVKMVSGENAGMRKFRFNHCSK